MSRNGPFVRKHRAVSAPRLPGRYGSEDAHRAPTSDQQHGDHEGVDAP